MIWSDAKMRSRNTEVRFTIWVWVSQFVSAKVLSASSTRYALPPTASSWPVAFRFSAREIWSMGIFLECRSIMLAKIS